MLHVSGGSLGKAAYLRPVQLPACASLPRPSSAGYVLDYWVRDHSETEWGKGWFSALTNRVFEQSDAMDCTTLSGAGCEIEKDL